MAGSVRYRSGRAERLGERLWRVSRKAARQVSFMEAVVAAYYTALDKDTPLIIQRHLAISSCRSTPFPDRSLGLGFTDDASRADGGTDRDPRLHDAGASRCGAQSTR